MISYTIYKLLYSKYSSLKGQSLVETLVALSIALVLLTVTTVAVITALRNSQASKDQGLATNYAVQGMEMARQIRDSSWLTFDSYSGQYCLAQSCQTISSSGSSCGRITGSCGKNIGQFSRDITFERQSASCRVTGSNGTVSSTRVVVQVSWADSTCLDSSTLCRKVVQESCLANIRGAL